MSDIDKTLGDFLVTTKNMESKIISIISDSNRDIEIILKELLVYLDSTSKNLEKVQESLISFVEDYSKNDASDISTKLSESQEGIKAIITSYSNKLANIETNNTKVVLKIVKTFGEKHTKLINQLTVLINKISTDIRGYGENNILVNADVSEIKSLLVAIANEVKDTKTNVSSNQDNLMGVINSILDVDKRKTANDSNVEVQRIKSDVEIAKSKSKLIAKIASIVLGSGGVIYVLIDVLIKVIK